MPMDHRDVSSVARIRVGGACAIACCELVRVGGALRAPRRQSLLRSQARCALLPAATPRLRTSKRVLRRGGPASETFSGGICLSSGTPRLGACRSARPQKLGACASGRTRRLDAVATGLRTPPEATASSGTRVVPCDRRFRLQRRTCAHRRTRHDVLKRGVAAGRSAQRACERSSDWRRGGAASPDPDEFATHNLMGSPTRTSSQHTTSWAPPTRTSSPHATSWAPQTRTSSQHATSWGPPTRTTSRQETYSSPTVSCVP